MSPSAPLASEAKRRRVCPPTRAPFEGGSLVDLLALLKTNAPCVKVEALDALGAPVANDSEMPLDESVESIRITAEGVFVAKIEGLGGAARLETLLVGGGEGEEKEDEKKTKTNASGGATESKIESIVVTVSPFVEEGTECVLSEGADDPNTDTAVKKQNRPSRAHALLTKRAREVFAKAAGENQKTKNNSEKIQTLRCITVLSYWLDDMFDVFTAPDPSNDGLILAPDVESGGGLVPSRLLRSVLT